MTPEQREDFLTLVDTGRATPDRMEEYRQIGLIRRDRYGSWVLTDTGQEAYNHIKKGI